MEEKKLSYSQVSLFQECEVKYYNTYKLNLERIQYKSTFLIGNVVQFGINLIFKKVNDPLKQTMKFFDLEKNKLRKGLNLSTEDEDDLNDQEMAIRGIIKAYPIVHAKFLKDVTAIEPEKSVSLIMGNGIKLVGRVDNLIWYKRELWGHELKTTKSISPEYVKSIQTNLQIAGYFHAYNSVYTPKMKGIIFDLIQKPSIRQKKDESRRQFLERLAQYYLTDSNEKFYMERIEHPLIKRHNVEKVFTHVGKRMLECKTEDDYTPNYRSCNNYGRCDFWDICHIGRQPVVMQNYRDKYSKATKAQIKEKIK